MEDTQNNASQASTNEAPLNDAQMKSGMLDAINTELDAKTTPVEKPESAETPIVEKPVVDELTDKPVKKEAVKKEVTKEDPYVMPEGLQPASQKRFQNLVDIAKQATAKVQDIEKSAKFHSETIDNFRAILEETKTSPEDLNQLLEYNRMVKSGDLEGAIKLLDEQRSHFGFNHNRIVGGHKMPASRRIRLPNWPASFLVWTATQTSLPITGCLKSRWLPFPLRTSR